MSTKKKKKKNLKPYLPLTFCSFFLCGAHLTICHLLNTLRPFPTSVTRGPDLAFLPCSRIVDKMHDSATGIRPSPNVEQGSTYKKTFIGEPSLSEGRGNRGVVSWDAAVPHQPVVRPELPAGHQAGLRRPRWERPQLHAAGVALGLLLCRAPRLPRRSEPVSTQPGPPPMEAGPWAAV